MGLFIMRFLFHTLLTILDDVIFVVLWIYSKEIVRKSHALHFSNLVNDIFISLRNDLYMSLDILIWLGIKKFRHIDAAVKSLGRYIV